jgi:hypothetical protein
MKKIKKILIFTFITVLGLFFVGFSQFNVNADEIRSGSYLGTIKYERVVNLTHNDYRGMLRAPVSFAQNDDRYRDLYLLLDTNHSYYFGSRDAYYNFPSNVDVYVSTYQKHATLETPAVNFLLVSKEIVVDTMAIFDTDINFYCNGTLEFSYTKQDILEYFDYWGYLGYESIYLRFVFDFDTAQSSWEVGYGDGFVDGYDDAIEKVYNHGFTGTDFTDNLSYPYNQGFNDGIETASDNTFYGIISQVFTGLGTFLAIELLPNITFGAILAVPLVFGIIFFIIGKRGGKDD